MASTTSSTHSARSNRTTRSTRDVLEDHLALRRTGDLETDLERNYTDDVLAISLTGIRHGRDGIRQMAAELRDDIPNSHYTYDELVTADEIGMLVWSAESEASFITEATDSYVVRNGRIAVQTVHYHVWQRGEDPNRA